MPVLYALIGALVGGAVTYFIEVQRAARERRDTLFADAMSAVLVDRANAYFPTGFLVSPLSPDDRAVEERNLRVDAVRRRALGIVERRAALARTVPYAPEVESFVDRMELSEAEAREVWGHLLRRLQASGWLGRLLSRGPRR